MASQQGHKRDRAGAGQGRGDHYHRGDYRGDGAGVVHIGAEEIYKQVIGAREDLIRTEGRVGQIDKGLADLQASLNERLRAFDERLTPVERRSWAMPSAAALLGVAALALTIMQMAGVGGG